jgi:hypothetical protein
MGLFKNCASLIADCVSDSRKPAYWTPRERFEYYAVVRRWLDDMGPLESILDVGCFDTPVATWGQATERYTVDTRHRPELPGVNPITGRWPDCATLVPVCDVVTCLQVLEHLDEPATFAGALFAHARRCVVISVPWKWASGAEASHKQDPVDGVKLRSWTGRDAAETVVCGHPARAVVRYDLCERVWK